MYVCRNCGRIQLCFFSWFPSLTATITPVCTMHVDERIDCGHNGMRKEQCLGRGCCWQPTNQNGAPWCFQIKRKLCQFQKPQGAVNFSHISFWYLVWCAIDLCGWYDVADIPIYTGQCGTPAIPPSVATSGRIVGGTETKPHSWPWQVCSWTLNAIQRIK